MSYVSLLKNIPDLLAGPTGIAAIASVGIHGAIAFLLPLMPVEESNSKALSKTKTVGLVELNQSEQNRLPQPSKPLLALPTQANILPQVPPPNFLPQSTTALPPLPQPNSAANLALPPLPKSTNVSIASLPQSQSLKIISKRDLQPTPTFSQRIKPFPRFQEKVSITAAKPLETSSVRYRVPSIQAANIIQQQEMVNNAVPITPGEIPRVSVDGNTTTQASLGTDLPNVAPKPLTPVDEPPQAEGNTVVGTPRFEQIPQQEGNIEVARLPSAATQQTLKKTTSFSERFAAVRNQYRNIETRLPISATVDAKAGQEGSVEGDLVVNSEGQVESINFHDDSVSPEIRTATKDYFRKYFQNNPTQANGKPKFYPFDIAFKSNSEIKPETTQEIAPQTNSVKAASDSQSSLIQRLRRSPNLNPQPAKEPKEDNNQTQVRLPEVNSQLSSKEPQTNSRRLRSLSNQQVNQEQQTSRQQVAIKQNPSASPVNQEQTSQKQVVITQPSVAPEANQQQIPDRQVVVNNAVPTPPVNQEQEQQEVSNNQSTAPGEPSKLIRQLREIREKRQSSN